MNITILVHSHFTEAKTWDIEPDEKKKYHLT